MGALEVGVPAFNSGDAQLCAEVYEVCAKDIMSQVSAEVSRGIAEADKASAVAASAVERAWIWRRALDAVLDHARRGQAGNATSTDPPTLSASEKVLVSKDSRAEVVNDTVMGGVSRSAWAGGTFYGHVTRERNGGFCSARFPLRPGVLRGAQALEIDWESDGRLYKLQLTDERGVQWQRDLSPDQKRVELRDLQPSFRGMPMRGAVLDTAGVRSVGLMLSFLQDDGSKHSGFRDGDFQIRIHEIRVAS